MRKLTEAEAYRLLCNQHPDETTRRLAKQFADREWERRHGKIYHFEYDAAELVEAV